MALLISLVAQLAATSAAAIEPPDLTLGSKKAELVRSMEGRGVALVCREAAPFDPPGLSAEICEGKTEQGRTVLLFSPAAVEASRAIAASYAYPSSHLADFRRLLEQRLGKPSKQSTSRMGESLIWLQGVRQISLRAGCSADHLCIEVSQDATARRLARSSGVFVIAPPGF